jgi:hypothetical protein
MERERATSLEGLIYRMINVHKRGCHLMPLTAGPSVITCSLLLGARQPPKLALYAIRTSDEHGNRSQRSKRVTASEYWVAC